MLAEKADIMYVKQYTSCGAHKIYDVQSYYPYAKIGPLLLFEQVLPTNNTK
jgi:hypothetical protein